MESILNAVSLIVSADEDLLEIVGLSLRVSLFAVLLATIIGLPLGAATALIKFPGQKILIISLNSLMGMPPVVIGLIVYLLLSRIGPLGVFGLLYSPTAMIIAQTLLIIPIISSLSRQVLNDLWTEYAEQLLSLRASPIRRILTLIWDGRFSLLTAVLAGFGRASAEVGAVMIVGGNIDHHTRVMTTSIALEVSKGNLSLALGLGIILIIISLSINAVAFTISNMAERIQS
tara:strand:+ start:108 stop:800 length:693 start_codon:yes stop_codon:yes gene_type:complete